MYLQMKYYSDGASLLAGKHQAPCYLTRGLKKQEIILTHKTGKTVDFK